MRSRTADPKVMVGIALMVLATALGGLVMQRATQRVAVWQLDHDLAAGSRLAAGDAHLAELALDQGVATYALATNSIVGRVVSRDLSAGELVPVAALGRSSLDHDRVTVPVESGHLPPALRRGLRVDVWLTPNRADGTFEVTRRVLAAALVDAVAAGDVRGRAGVVLAVPRGQVPELVAALRRGSIDLVAVGSGS